MGGGRDERRKRIKRGNERLSAIPCKCYRTGGDVDIAIGAGAVAPVVIFPPSPRTDAADVLNPSCRMAVKMSAF